MILRMSKTNIVHTDYENDIKYGIVTTLINNNPYYCWLFRIFLKKYKRWRVGLND